MDTIIDRYLASVSEALPVKLREDTVKEIRSLIQDALDDRSKAEGRAPDDEMMADVLKQFGPPEKIVAPYLPEKYLIGPRLYPAFITVIKIALPIIAILSLVGFWVGLIQSGQITGTVLITNLVKSAGNALSSVVQAFGNIVFIFAILQWAIPEFRFPDREKEWNPRDLKAVSHPDKIKWVELVIDIALMLVGLIILNFYFDRIAIYNLVNGDWVGTPFMTSAFTAYIPWINLLWILTILLDIILLRRGSWETGTRIFAILVSAFNIGLAASLMTNIPYLYTFKGAVGLLGVEGMLHSLLNQVLLVVFVIVIIVNAVKIVQMMWRLFKIRLPALGSPVK